MCSAGQDGYIRIWRGSSYDPYLEIEMNNPIRVSSSQTPHLHFIPIKFLLHFQAVAWHPWRSGLLVIGEGPPGPSSISLWNVNTGLMLQMEKLDPNTIVLAMDFNTLSGELVCSLQTNGK